MSNKSLSDRKKQFLEDCCGGGGDGGAMMGGNDAYQGDAAAEGPYAGFDPMLGKKKKLKDTLKKLRGKGGI